MDLYKIIRELAEIPSYSEHEELIHPYIRQFAADYFPQDTEIIEIGKSLFIKIPGTLDQPPITLAAHLDKIPHNDLPTGLAIEKFEETETEISGHLDDAIGLGLCLYISKLYSQQERPPIYLYLTEMKECGHIGAFRLKLYFDANPGLHATPWAIISLDVLSIGGTSSILAVDTNCWAGNMSSLFHVVPGSETMLCFHPSRRDYAIYNYFFTDSVSFCLEAGCRNMRRLVERAYKRDVDNALLVAKNIIDNGLGLYRKQLSCDIS